MCEDADNGVDMQLEDVDIVHDVGIVHVVDTVLHVGGWVYLVVEVGALDFLHLPPDVDPVGDERVDGTFCFGGVLENLVAAACLPFSRTPSFHFHADESLACQMEHRRPRPCDRWWRAARARHQREVPRGP